MQKRWEMVRPDPAVVKMIREALAVRTVTATIMANRNIRTVEAARAFYTPTLNQLEPPFAMRGMDEAVERIHRAIVHREKILIFGDYDVDGITSTALLCHFLQSIGGRVATYLPHRLREGYGLQVDQILRYAVPNAIDLIITVDCGSSSHGAVGMANEAGIDVIITDHHQIAEKMPTALAVVNPKRGDCHSGFDSLAGVGVAFCLLISLRKHLREKNYWPDGGEPNLKNYCDLVALGTVADIVPMTTANRIFTKTGVMLMNRKARPGLAALMKIAGVAPNQLTAEDIAFRLAPRLNAAGRMDHAGIAVELLLTHQSETAEHLAGTMQKLNLRRQETETGILNGITARLEREPALLEANTLVLSGQDWHEGVLGIIASKLTRQYHRPTVILTEDHQSGLAKGSARSIPGLNLYEILTECEGYLTAYGGHALAAGLKISIDQIDPLRRTFDGIVTARIQADPPSPAVRIDCELFFKDISSDLVDELEALAPFGELNPPPLFMSQNIEVLKAVPMAEKHLKLRLRQKGTPGKIFDAVRFNIDPAAPLPTFFNQIAFHLQWNRWNGYQRIQLIIQEG